MKTLPRSKERGLIEASRLTSLGSGSAALPRSKERGLIEAVGRRSIQSPRQTFRVQKNAASLKHTLRFTAYGILPGLPRSKERGLIEACLLG